MVQNNSETGNIAFFQKNVTEVLTFPFESVANINERASVVFNIFGTQRDIDMTKRESGIQKNLSPAEWLVMKIIWEVCEGAARDIYTIACERHDWAVDTVKTMLRRPGRAHVFSPMALSMNIGKLGDLANRKTFRSTVHLLQ